jgi:hypothetical protein
MPWLKSLTAGFLHVMDTTYALRSMLDFEATDGGGAFLGSCATRSHLASRQP